MSDLYESSVDESPIDEAPIDESTVDAGEPPDQNLPRHEDQLYVPSPGEAHFTWRAVVAGCALGGIVSCMNIYFGLRTGWSIGGSLIAAILGYSLFSAIRPKAPYGVLETNITQTAGSAAGSMTSAAGLLACIPALGMLGVELSYIELTLWALSIAYLGVFFAVPLRRQMVLVDKLRFPTGTATAQTIMAMFASGAETIEKSRALLKWGLIAAVFTLAAYFVPELGMPPLEFAFFGTLSMWGFSLLINPLMFGAGFLIGPRVATSLFLGAVFSWGFLGPWVQSQGWVDGAIMSYSDGVRGWILWPGVAIMVADAFTTLALSWRSIVNTFRRSSFDEGVDTAPDAIPNLWWIGGLAIATVATVCMAWFVFDIPPHLTVIAVALSSLLAAIAVRSTGETDINPIGGMGKVTQLVYGGIAPGMMTTNLLAAGITGAGASQAGDMMQDLKTGYMLGASPRSQFKAQLVGILAGVLFCVPIYKLFDTAYDIGGEQLPAPAAHAWKAMAELLSKGFDALPANAEIAVAAAFVFGVAMPLLRRVEAIKKYVPSGLAFGIAFIVPAYYSVAMFIGALILIAWQRARPQQAERLVFSVASGLIAGEGLMGIVTAVLTLLGIEPITGGGGH